MKQLLAFLLLFFFVTFLKSQTTKIGVFYARNFSSQTNFNPQKPEDGSYQTDYRNSFGLTAFLEKKITESFWLRSEFGYRGKGDREHYQQFISGSPDLTKVKEETHFHYFSAEISPVYYLNKYDFGAVPYLLAGLNFNYLTKIQYGYLGTLNGELPATLFEQAESKTLGFHVGAGLQISKALFLDGRLVRDISPVLDLENIRIKHWVWSVNLGVDLSRLF